MNSSLALVAALLAVPLADDVTREGSAAHREQVDALEGQPAPRWQLTEWRNTDGEYYELEEFRGKVVVLVFMDVERPVTKRELADWTRLERASRDNVQWVGIHASETRKALPAFLAEQPIDWPIAVDIGRRTRAAYAVDEEPDCYLIDRNGTLRFADVAPESLGAAIDLLVAEAAPEPTVFERIDELLANMEYETYEAWEEGERVGRLRLVTRKIDVVESDPYLVYFDDVENTENGDVSATRFVTNCRWDEHLSPFEWSASGGFRQERVVINTKIANGKLTGRVNESEVVRAVRAPFGSELTLLRVAATLPFEPGHEVRVERFDASGDFKIFKDEKLVCRGLETIRIKPGAEETELFKIEHLFANGKVFATFWFEPTRRLKRATFASDWLAGERTWFWVPRPPKDE